MTTIDEILTELMDRLDPSFLEHHMLLAMIWYRFKEFGLHHEEIFVLLDEQDHHYLIQIRNWLTDYLGWYWLGWSNKYRKLWQVVEDINILINMYQGKY